MREILFRGKSIERETNKDGRRGEWVYGGIEITRRSQPETVWIAVDEYYWYDGPLCETYEVDPETVGQYSERHDKKQTKIFEGDILVKPAFLTNIHDTDNLCICKFVRDKSVVGLALCDHDVFGEYDHIIPSDEWDEFEVIGNIYDNLN